MRRFRDEQEEQSGTIRRDPVGVRGRRDDQSAGEEAWGLANAIESFGVRLRNEGFSDSTLACRTPRIPVMVGQAVTLRVRSSDPPMGDVFYLDQPDWWERLDIEPSEHPRVLVIEDIDHHPGRGALVGALRSEERR